MRYYKEKPVRMIDPEQTIYELVFNSNIKDLDDPAIEYQSLVWSFRDLKEKTDYVANAFSNAGYKCGDVVMIGAMNCPETVVLLLALNKIGVISKWIDIRAGEKDLEEYVNESNCKVAVFFDCLIPVINNVIDKTNIEKILIINPASIFSVDMDNMLDPDSIDLPSDARYELFWDYINRFHGGDALTISFIKDRPSVMVMSSGTTGKAKVVVHSDYSVTSAIKKLSYYDMPVEPGKAVYSILPPWIIYGMEMAVLYPLALGAKIILIDGMRKDALIDHLGKYHIAFGVPFHLRYLFKHFDELSDDQKTALLDQVDFIFTGGDKITADELDRFEARFNTPIINGYGSNEGYGCLSACSMKMNKHGAVGIPKYGDTVIAYDNENEKELKYGEVGELCFLTDTHFLYYENCEDDVPSVMRKHSDGRVWMHTGDLGYIDEDGFIFLQGRIRRVIIRFGFKISAYTIEDKICEHPLVKECVAVEVPDPVDEHVPMAYVVLEENCNISTEQIEKEIIDKCSKELKQNEIPKYFSFVDKLPYTDNGKYDFRRLEQWGTEYVESL